NVPEEEVKKTRITLVGKTFSFSKGSQVGTSPEGTITIDPSKKPKTVDSTATVGPDKGKTSLGIYEIKGDLHTVCFAPPGKERPQEFVSKPGSGHNLQVWKLEKK